MAARSRGHGWWHVVLVVTCLGIAVARSRPAEIVPGTGSKPEQVVAAEPTVALEPLDRDVLVRRALDIFPAGYLAIISIIQGVALSVLLAETVPLVVAGGRGTSATIATGAQALLVFVAIVIVSYEYLWFTTILRWVPTFRDTLVPLLLGVGEIVPAFLMERWTAWWLVMTIFIVFGGGAYLNTITRLHRALFGGDDDHVRHRISCLLWKLVAQCGGGILIGAGTLWAVIVWPDAAAPLTAVSASVLAFGIAVGMVVISEGVLNEVFARHGIRRRPEWPRWENVGWTLNH